MTTNDHQITMAILAAWNGINRMKNIDTDGMTQETILQIHRMIEQGHTLVALLKEERRLLENTLATDCGAYEGVNG